MRAAPGPSWTGSSSTFSTRHGTRTASNAKSVESCWTKSASSKRAASTAARTFTGSSVCSHSSNCPGLSCFFFLRELVLLRVHGRCRPRGRLGLHGQCQRDEHVADDGVVVRRQLAFLWTFFGAAKFGSLSRPPLKIALQSLFLPRM